MHVSSAVKAGASVGALVMAVLIIVVAVFIMRRKTTQHTYVNPEEISYVLFCRFFGEVVLAY